MKQKISQIFTKAAIAAALALFTTSTVSAQTIVTSSTTTMTTGTYQVTTDVTISARITVSGDVTLLLGEGATLNATAGISIQQGNTLTIDGKGSLIATATSNGHAGIGGDGYGGKGGNIIINGGTITATGNDASNGGGGAGIGAGYGDNSGNYESTFGNITITGGTITANGAYGAAGIGSGDDYSTCGNILICGGTVNATGGYWAAGIGSGRGFNAGTISSICGSITISGGNITATKGVDPKSSSYTYTNQFNSIGAGYHGSCGTVTIGGVQGAIKTSPYTINIVPATYVVSFNANGGTGSMSNQSFNIDFAKPLTRNTFTRDGYFFTGWSNSADGDVDYVNGQTVTNLASANGTKTLYAKWMSANELPEGMQVDADYRENETGFYYVNIPLSESTPYPTKTITINDTKFFPFKIYDAGGKDNDVGKTSAGNLIINAPAGYNINLSGNVTQGYKQSGVYIYAYENNSEIFSSNGLVSDVSSTGSSIKLYLQGILNFMFSPTIFNLELTATTSIIDFTLTYVGTDGATFATANPSTYTIYSDEITLAQPTREGYTFLGWTYEGQDEPTTTVTIPKGSTGNKEFTANWAKLLTNADITIPDIPAQTYTGSAIEPEITVTDGEKTLILGTDYTVSYSDNTNVGTAKATITGIGNYIGTVEKTFTISPKVTNLGALTLTEDQNGISTEIGGDYNGSDVAYSLESDIENVSVIFNRTFTAGVTSTIVLPFDIEADGYSGGEFYEFSDIDTKTWTATMSKVTSVKAHTPYLFVPSGESLTISQKVTLKAASSTTAATTAQNGWTFTGVYQKKVWNGNDGGNKDYCFAANSTSDGVNPGDFVKIGTYVQVRAFRCYLTNSTLAKSKTDLPEKITIRLIDETSSVVNPDDPDPLTPEDSGDITTPVSEITPNSGTKVWSYDRTIFIEAQSSTDYQIIDLSGRMLLSGTTNSTREEITLNRTVGIVIVKIGGKTFKVNY